MPRLILLACFLLVPAQAQAQSCSSSVSNVNFGNVDTLSGAAADTTATVNISCNGGPLGANFRVCLNINAGTGGATSGTRHMRNATSAALDYNLYQEAARITKWGSREQPALGNPVAVNLTALPLTTAMATRTIYARVSGSQQSAAAGLYTSSFSGSQVSFNWTTYLFTPPACGSVTQNPVRPSFMAQANVVNNCNVTAQNINFGSHGVLDAAADAAGAVGVTCTPGTTYNVGLNNGLSGTGPTARRMMLGGQAVTYGLYMDAARSQPWGGTIGTDTFAGTGAGATQNLPVYGRVPAQSTPSPGTYTDTVVVTVTY
ncbi:spore coat protein U domain-containing protein [Mesorhizobium sp.]|uniref:Csu type fimbrial protein n=1 Tax=Mesorhizobium sp. TaxID=1871066 RepID=UPI0011F52BA4|nr:spore coat protein U domain-containing protein [Mesorhizobium sp.]TIO31260.1 MAG: spore coat U domain-containing protein [Mesorhizobium sp.]